MLQSNRPDLSVLQQFGYTSIVEQTYSFDHPEVQLWTETFENRTHEREIFTAFERRHPNRSLAKAKVVGTQWHRFSVFMPWFLCQASAMMPNNTLRHYVIQTAFEELGMRDATEIHADLFWRTVEMTGVTLSDRDRLDDTQAVTHSLEYLRTKLLGASSVSQILGLMLGLEIPARENIETVYSSLAHRPDLDEVLSSTKFFALHRQIEIEHVRMNVANFLRFCPDTLTKAEFVDGFERGLEFWQMFWNAVSSQILRDQSGTL